MIQRIQSVFLVLVLVGIALMFVFPIANISFIYEGQKMTSLLMLFPKKMPMEATDMMSNEIGQSGFVNTLYLIIIAAAMAILTFITILGYKNRPLQVKIIAFTVLLNMAYLGILLFLTIDDFANALASNFKTTTVIKYSVGAVIPIITMVFYILAQRFIKKDEKLVRSADRLR